MCLHKCLSFIPKRVSIRDERLSKKREREETEKDVM
jgi:hypothetical protein